MPCRTAATKIAAGSIPTLLQRTKIGQTTHWAKLTLDSSSVPASTAPTTWKVERQRVHEDDDTAAGVSLLGLLQNSADSKSQAPATTISARMRAVAQHARDSVLTVFFPKDMTRSVTPDYLPYTLWHLANSITGTIAGTLSMQALLQALGLGAGSAIGLAATTNWIIKDGFGLLGGVLFAGFMGNRFDASPKYYRFLANICIQLANLMELLTPLVPHLFLPMASLSNIGKNIGWLAASATRASMHRGFTRGDNLGDITAKAGAQATAAGLVGTGGGIVLSWMVGTDPMTLMCSFIPLSLLNLYAAYRSNRAVVTRNMNIERAELCIRHYLDGSHMPTPEAISKQETMIGRRRHPFRIELQLEPSIENSILRSFSQNEMRSFIDGELAKTVAPSYRIIVSQTGGQPVLSLWFLDTATSTDITAGFVHACMLRHAIELGYLQITFPQSSGSSMAQFVWTSLEKEHAANVHAAYKTVDLMAAAGWDIQHTHLGDASRRLVLK
eukprot:jgi/Hompol1/5896/HPOL_000332-RA